MDPNDYTDIQQLREAKEEALRQRDEIQETIDQLNQRAGQLANEAAETRDDNESGGGTYTGIF